ncbi:MAG: calcium-binding protein [Hyphomicrobium sp.]
MPIRPQRWHGAFRVNLGTEIEGANFPDSHDGPNSVTALTNGGFVATWTEFDAAGNVRLRAQIFNAFGGRVGGEIAVNTNANVGHSSNNANDGHLFDVAAQPGGGFVVAWARQVNGGDVAFQRFSNTGVKLGGETNVAGAGSADREWDPSIAMLKNGNFVVTWVDDSAAGANVHASVYTPGGTLSGSGTDLNVTASVTTTLGGFPADNDVTATADGGFVVTYRNLDDVRYSRWAELSAGGGPLFFAQLATDKVSTQATGTQSNPAAAGLTNGGWAVAYADEIGSFDQDVHLRVYDSSGMVVSTQTLAATTSREGSISIAAGPDGTFLVTWDRWIETGLPTDPAEIDVMAQLFSNNGTAVGSAFQVNTEAIDNGTPVVTALSDGRYAISWMRDDAFRSPVGGHTFVQIVDGRDARIIGDNAANVLVGHDTGQTILNDFLAGLGGNDALFGLAGNDILNGGLGRDRMNGGLGNDKYVVDDRLDVVAELARSGNDTVQTSIAYALGGNVENLVLLGTSGLTGKGNAVDNILIGNAGANALFGLAGNDTLNSGLGNDQLFGGTGRDSFVFSTAPNGVSNHDAIRDFNVVFDTIRLENTGAGLFNALGAGVLSAAAFFKAAGAVSAHDASDRIVYNTQTGDLYYDRDGIGGAAAVKFATLTTLPVLTNADIVVF